MDAKLASWQFWTAFKKTLGESTLLQVWGKRDARIIRMYSQDPRTTAGRCHDPVENLHSTLSMMDELGRGDVGRKLIDYLHTAIDGEPCSAVVPLKATMDAEKLADFSAVAAFQRAMEEGAEVDLVETLMREAQDEIERTYAKWLEG